MISLKLLISSLSWQTASMVIQAFFQLTVMAVLARHLSAEDFGIVAATNVVIMMVQMLAEAGVGSVLIQRSCINENIIAAATQISLFIGVLFTFLMVLFSAVIEGYFEIYGLSDYIKVLSFSFIIVALTKIPESLLQRKMKFDILMKTNLFSFLFGYTLPALLLGLNGFGAWSLILASFIQIAVKAVVLICIEPVIIFRRSAITIYKEVLQFGAGITSIKVWEYFYRQGDKLVMGRTMGTAELGQYHITNQLAFLPGQYVGNIADAVFFPVMARLCDKKEQLGKMLIVIQGLALYTMTALGMYMAIFGKEIIEIIYGGSWLSVVLIFQILSVGAGMRSATRMGDIANRALGRLRAASANKLIMALFLILAVFLTSPGGLPAVAIAVVVSNAVALLLTTSIAVRGLHVTLSVIVLGLLRFIVCGLLFSLIIYILHSLTVVFESNLVIRLLVTAPLAVMSAILIGYLAFKKDLIDLKNSIFDKKTNTVTDLNEQSSLDNNSLTLVGDIYLQDGDRVDIPFDNIIPNIEAPITTQRLGAPNKVNLKSSRQSVEDFVKNNNVLLACLGNNHIYDYKERGLHDTLEFFDKKNIPHIGAVCELKYENNYKIIDISGKKIAFISQVCSTTSAVFATHSSGGVIQKDIQKIGDSIKKIISKDVDYIVIIMHWGAEEVSVANPEDIIFARRCVDYGADLVVGHHAHCIQQYENYKNKWIFYGVGNAYFNDFDVPSMYESSGESFRKKFKKNQRYWNKKGLAVHLNTENLCVSASLINNKNGTLNFKPLRLKKRLIVRMELYRKYFRIMYILFKLRVIVVAFYHKPRFPKISDIKQLCRLMVSEKYS